MTPPELLALVEGLGYRLSLRPGGLRLSGGLGEPAPAVLAMIQEHRAGVLALLVSDARDHFEERAAILEFDAGFTRAEAERRAGLEVEAMNGGWNLGGPQGVKA